MNAAVEFINIAGRAFVDFALPMLIQSGALIVILLVIDALLRKRVRAVFRYWIWMLVLVKLVLPPSLWSPVSIGTWLGDPSAAPQAILSEPADPEPAARPAPVPFSPSPDIAPRPTASLPAPGDVYRVPEPSPATPVATPPIVAPAESLALPPVALTWQGVVLLCWAAVAAALLLLLLQRGFFVRGLVAQAEEADAAMKEILAQCLTRLGMRRAITVKVSPAATSPAVCGLLHPIILIPQNLAARLGGNDLQAILLHELAHVKRRDLWVNLAQTLLQIVYFYNPLLWLANAMIRRTREQAVDETVLVAMGAAAEQYPETLVNIAKLALTSRPTLTLRLIGVVESKTALTTRIKHILTRPIPKSARLSVLGLLTILIVGAVLLPMARARQDEAGELLSRLAVLPNCGVWLSDIAGHDLPVLDLASDEIVNLPGVRSDYELLKTITEKGKGDILYYYDKMKNTARITFLRRAGLGGKPASEENETVTITPMQMPFKTIVTTQRGDRFRVRIIRVDEKACSIQFHPLGDSRPTYKAILSGGIVAEFLGVYEHPREGQTWWRPDGMGFLSEPPLDGEYFNRLKGESFNLHPSRKEAVCVVAIRLYHGPDTGLANASISPSRREAQVAVVGVGDGNIRRDLCWGAAILPQSQKSCSVRCLIRTGPWETMAKVSAQALADRCVAVNGVTFSGIIEDSNGGAAVTARHKKADGFFRITAVTTDGHTIEAPSAGGNSGPFADETSGRFPSLMFAKVEEFQLQMQPRMWVEFNDVSLWPGRQTRVEVRDGIGEDQVSQINVVLPEADRRPLALDLASGDLISLPAAGPEPRKLLDALRTLGKGDLIYDYDSGDRTLILLRDAISDPAREGTGEAGIKGYLIGRQFPETLTVTTAEGWRYAVTILATDNNGCTLRYSLVSTDTGVGGGARVEVASAGQTQVELQRLVDDAPVGGLVAIPGGTYVTPITITKPVVLRGVARQECVFEVTADQPAISINTKGPGEVTVENVTIRWQLATSGKVEQPFALAVRDTNVVIRGCRFEPLGNEQRSPVAVRIDGFSRATVDNCRFSGFGYTVCYGPGSEGVVQDCVLTDPGHQGVTNYENSTLRVERTIVIGSKYHGLRCTGGTLHVKDCLLADNRNSAIYLGNKDGQGAITNNVMLRNATGVAGFYQSQYTVENNAILGSTAAGIGMWDTCRLDIRNNIFQGNAKALVVYPKGSRDTNVIGHNTFWRNAADTENCRRAADSILADPQLADPNHGDFSTAGPAKEQNHGLSDPRAIRQLWPRYEQAQRECPADSIRRSETPPSPARQAEPSSSTSNLAGQRGERIEQLKVEFKDRLPSLRQTLLTGDSEARFEVLKTLQGEVGAILDDSFLPAMQAAAGDPDRRVRDGVARIAGGRWIWGAEKQDPNAIALVLQLSRDSDRDVRHNAVYFGLSTVRDKGESVVRRLVEMALADHENNLYGRIVWSLEGPMKAAPELFARVLAEHLDRARFNVHHAGSIYALHQDVLKKEPPAQWNLAGVRERYPEDVFALSISAREPFKPQDGDALWNEFVKSLPQGVTAERLANRSRRGEIVCIAKLRGKEQVDVVKKLIESSPRLQSSEAVPLTLTAQLFLEETPVPRP